MRKFKAFTMAEAILVMTILGIIATIMITTLKPATYKEEALKILADKVLGEIDIATSQILLNDSPNGTMDGLMTADAPRKSFNIDTPDVTYVNELAKLYKKYLVTKRGGTADNKLILKDGAYIEISNTKNADSFFPGELQLTKVEAPYGFMTIDSNGTGTPPDVSGKDIFVIPFGKTGIDYEPKASAAAP